MIISEMKTKSNAFSVTPSACQRGSILLLEQTQFAEPVFGQTAECSMQCTKSAPESANTRNPGGPQPVRTPVVGLAESTCSNSKFADNLGTVAQRSRAAASRHHWKRVTSKSSESGPPARVRRSLRLGGGRGRRGSTAALPG